MDVLPHDNIAINIQVETTEGSFQTVKKEIENRRRREVGLAMITAKSEEAALSGLVKSPQAASHEESLYSCGARSVTPRLAPKKRAGTWCAWHLRFHCGGSESTILHP